jgi:hypothetical protein
MNIFGTYDGNILGGLLLGFGMTLTGACPGTVLPQVVTSVSSGPLVLLGGVLGGILWSGFGKRLLVQKKEIVCIFTKHLHFGCLMSCYIFGFRC